ncbi:MAG: hypothetical protein R2831_10915 [Chitinophagaceae bacterium]
MSEIIEKKELIEVPKEQLATLLAINEENKQKIATYEKSLEGAVNLVSFLKGKIFMGEMPEKFSLVTISKLAKNIYNVFEELKDDKEALEKLKQDMEMLKGISVFMSENQIKSIGEHGNE